MATASATSSPGTDSGLPANQVYAVAGFCFVVGLLLGYTILGPRAIPTIGRGTPPAAASNSIPGNAATHPQITLQQMKQMADVQASGLVEKAKTDPNNATLLLQIARIYLGSHQFKDAADYFEKALKIQPKDVSARTELASCLYYSGDVDAALDQLNQVLKYSPKDVNALFNLGMIKYRGKKDGAGAIAAWQKLLRENPNLDRKPIVEQLIAEAKASTEAKK
ncbi:MAG: tetratricopeptide repeat protein [Candidatus Acidiferrum sp.]